MEYSSYSSKEEKVLLTHVFGHDQNTVFLTSVLKALVHYDHSLNGLNKMHNTGYRKPCIDLTGNVK